MSGQTDISEFSAVPEPATRSANQEHEESCRSSETQRWTDWRNYEGDSSKSECKNCGAKVDPEIGRVVGDRDNDLVRCADCHGSTGGQAQKLNTASHVSKMREQRSDVTLEVRRQ
jgi:hypothetical protein